MMTSRTALEREIYEHRQRLESDDDAGDDSDSDADDVLSREDYFDELEFYYLNIPYKRYRGSWEHRRTDGAIYANSTERGLR